MHIPDGFLPAQVCIGGYAIAGGITWYALRQINKTSDPHEEIPKAALLAATFFVGSSINVPIPPASVHLVLNGLLGALLSWYAWPAILIGLLLQAVLLGHGGLTTLGINAVIMGLPALIASRVFQLRYRLVELLKPAWSVGVFGFLAGALGFGLAALIFFGLTILTIPAGWDWAVEQRALTTLMAAYIPLMFAEGGFTVLTTLFLLRIKPELLES
ncbi:MAG: cobalt transporter CbiM [Cyanobacteria bacterium P01_F01_bin.86]